MKTFITNRFEILSEWISANLGSPYAFMIACALVALWAVSGPIFGFSDTWQLIINTGTTICTFLMVFLLQNTGNRTIEEMQEQAAGHGAAEPRSAARDPPAADQQLPASCAKPPETCRCRLSRPGPESLRSGRVRGSGTATRQPARRAGCPNRCAKGASGLVHPFDVGAQVFGLRPGIAQAVHRRAKLGFGLRQPDLVNSRSRCSR
jgi:hypothetical protein